MGETELRHKPYQAYKVTIQNGFEGSETKTIEAQVTTSDNYYKTEVTVNGKTCPGKVKIEPGVSPEDAIVDALNGLENNGGEDWFLTDSKPL